MGSPIDYARLVAASEVRTDTWNAFIRSELVERWATQYDARAGRPTQVFEITEGALTFLFDAAPTLVGVGGPHAADRVVAVWGCSRRPEGRRDRARMAGLVPNPPSWSGRGRDRGHFVAHSAGGGLELNVFPQASLLNRGRSGPGRTWRQMERYAAKHPGTALFVRPVYEGPGWAPNTIEYGLLKDDGLWFKRFANDDENREP